MKSSSIFIIAALLSATSVVAQTTASEQLLLASQNPSREQRLERIPVPANSEINFLFQEGILSSGEVVKNAPYTATAITETTMTLADGNRVVNNRTAQLARDSQGRTRREQTLGEIGMLTVNEPHMVLISDPAAQKDYLLYPEKKTAQLLKVREEVRVRRPGALGEEKLHYAGTVKEEALGTQVIEGLSCEGTRLVQTIPPGTIGNEREMVLTAETWISRDLHILVLRKRKGALTGETTYRLTNINRNEPDPSLFQVPADYKIESPKPAGWRNEEEK